MLLTSKGAATVSGGSFVVFAATVTATGILPLEGLAVLFGVYRFMSVVFSKYDEMVRAHPAAAATIPANFAHNGFLPFHEGATRWYQDASDVIMGD
jgi:TRAP-type uncharacterized transport system substrate-binding protein